MKTLRNKTIWIVGASSGIGESLARTLDARGAHLILSARRKEKLQDLKLTLKQTRHETIPVEVTHVSTIRAALKKIKKIDSVIFMAAAYGPHTEKRKPLKEMHHIMKVNFGGALNLVETVLPRFSKQGRGQIVLCSSVAGYRGLPQGQPYCASKAALTNYAESLYVECAPDNIDVKIISPGFVETPLTDKNNFEMPMIISAEKAANYICDGLTSRVFEIHFPKRFTFIMKILQILPNGLFFKVANFLRRRMKS